MCSTLLTPYCLSSGRTEVSGNRSGLWLWRGARAGNCGPDRSGRVDGHRSCDFRIRARQSRTSRVSRYCPCPARRGLGYSELAPYDRICLTAACTQIPSPLLEQLKSGGRLIAPVVELGSQNLTLIEKRADGISTEVICEVLYVSLRGQYGIKNE
jgi:hypothetical protein